MISEGPAQDLCLIQENSDRALPPVEITRVPILLPDVKAGILNDRGVENGLLPVVGTGVHTDVHPRDRKDLTNALRNEVMTGSPVQLKMLKVG